MADDNNSSLKGSELVNDVIARASGSSPTYPPGTAHVYREALKLPVCAVADAEKLALGCAVVAALERHLWPDRFSPKSDV
ncbi:MAG: hypothetical protein HYV68_00585 [Candidatus Taylorbacteria bacterium]|nr:hypothetical protein [Candidatus Taylorbacteria bacterium]